MSVITKHIENYRARHARQKARNAFDATIRELAETSPTAAQELATIKRYALS
jgi:uncharacterized protein YPO0396